MLSPEPLQRSPKPPAICAEVPIARRQVHFGDGNARETPVYRRADLPAGATFAGPAVLEQLDSTVLVPPGAQVEVDEWLNIRMAIEEEG